MCSLRIGFKNKLLNTKELSYQAYKLGWIVIRRIELRVASARRTGAPHISFSFTEFRLLLSSAGNLSGRQAH